MRTVYDESFFKKSKAPRLEFVEDLVKVPIHPMDKSRIIKVGTLLYGE